MTSRRVLAATLPLAAALLAACAGAPTAPTAAPTAAAATAAPTADAATACSALLTVNATNPPGADPDSPAPTAAELKAWADSLAGPLASVKAGTPATLAPDITVLEGVLDQARHGQRVGVDDEKINTALNVVNGWAYTGCGFQKLQVASTGGKLGPAPAALKAGPVALEFTTSGEPSAFVMLVARVKDGETVTAADVDAGRAAFDKVAEVVGAAQPAGAGPAYGTATLQSGRYLLVSPLGAPPNFSGTTSLDLTVA